MPLQTQKYGEINLGINFSYKPNEPFKLKFDHSDEESTKDIFKKNSNQMEFILGLTEATKHTSQQFFVYLGNDPLRKWDKNYEIRLEIQHHPSAPVFWKAHNEDVKRIKNNLWCAAKTRITLCDDRHSPILTEDGKYVQTTISLSFHEWYLSLYEGVKAGLKSLNQSANITTPFEQLESIAKAAIEEADGSEILALYLRIKSLLSVFNRSIEAIIKNPAQRPNSQIQFHQLYDLKAVNEHFSTNKQISFLSVQKVAKLGNKFYPCSFVSSEIGMTQDIPENRLVLQCIKQVQLHLEAVERELTKYIDYTKTIKTSNKYHKDALINDIKKHEAELKELQTHIQRCKQYRHRFPIPSSHSTFVSKNPASELLYYEQRYSSIWKLAAKIDGLIKYIDTSDEAIPFQVAPFQEVYQRWCLFRVVDALDKLGFIKIFTGESTPLYGNPQFNTVFCELEPPNNPSIKLKIYFERGYKTINSTSDHNDYGFWQDLYNPNQLKPEEWKRTPDIALEFHGIEPYPLIITLDPTLGAKQEYWSQKYKYKKTIFANQQPNPIPVVKAAWAIAPGLKEHSKEPYYLVELDWDFSEGVIILNHLAESQDRLSDTLRKIIKDKIMNLS